MPVRMVADMSSDIFSRPVDVSKYDLIYGGAQKNIAPAGVTFVIVKEDVLGQVDRVLPTMVNYKTHVDKGSMFNTPPVFPIYAALQTLKWYKELGGVKELQRIDEEKAAYLYDAIDSSRLFVGTVKPEDRSIMNVCFVMKPEYKELEKDFLDFATSKGIVGIKGHRSVGGYRASLYNALHRNGLYPTLADNILELSPLHFLSIAPVLIQIVEGDKEQDHECIHPEDVELGSFSLIIISHYSLSLSPVNQSRSGIVFRRASAHNCSRL